MKSAGGSEGNEGRYLMTGGHEYKLAPSLLIFRRRRIVYEADVDECPESTLR